MCKRNIFIAVVALSLMLCAAALAQGSDPQALWGWQPQLVSVILGVVAPFVTSLLAKSHWSHAAKRWALTGVALAATIATGIVSKSLTSASLSSEVIFTTFATVFTVATATYQLFARHFGDLTDATTKKN